MEAVPQYLLVAILARTRWREFVRPSSQAVYRKRVRGMKRESSGKYCGPPLARLGCCVLLLVTTLFFFGCSGDKAAPASTKVVETNNDPDVFTMQNGGDFPLTTVQVRKV